MFYDAAKDPTAIEITTTPLNQISPSKIMEAFAGAEPERQLCIICLLEAAGTGPLTEVKAAAVKRLLAKLRPTTAQ